MKITHNGEEWHGTFGVVLHAMITDLLSDGEPISLQLTLDYPAAQFHGTRRVEIDRISASEEYLISSTGEAFELDSILSVEVI